MFCTHTFILSKKLCCHIVYITLKNVIKYELNIFFKLVVSALFYQICGMTTIMIQYPEHTYGTILNCLPSIK